MVKLRALIPPWPSLYFLFSPLTLATGIIESNDLVCTAATLGQIVGGCHQNQQELNKGEWASLGFL